MHDGGYRYGIMTTNLAEVYNWVMRGARGMPLVGIVEFMLYRTCDYFIQRFGVADKAMADNEKVYGYKVTEYMERAITKARKNRVSRKGTEERRHHNELLLHA